MKMLLLLELRWAFLDFMCIFYNIIFFSYFINICIMYVSTLGAYVVPFVQFNDIGTKKGP